MSLVASLKLAGFNRTDVAAALALHPDTKGWAADATVRDLDRAFERSKPKCGRTQPADSDADPEEAPEWARYLQRDEKDTPLSNLANAMTALRSAPELQFCFAYDEMARTAMLLEPVPKGHAGDLPRPVCDGDVGQVQEWLQRHELRRLGTDTTHQAVDLRAAENSFHPVRDYLNSLQWDGTPRLGSWLHVYLGAEANAYTSAVGQCSSYPCQPASLLPDTKPIP